ncbi:MAG TPA: hypothetical protein VK444_08430 [Methanobacteriaceae archaeon]|nr:hypothetical protein [Methanobacteriaceae archaeon]
MYEGFLEVSGVPLPQTLLGTSPFIGAAQFGHRARLYQLDLYSNPANMLKIIQISYDMGVRGIQLLPHPPVIEALEMARNEGMKLDIVGTVRPEQELEDIQLLASLDAKAMLLHATITDKGDWDLIEESLGFIKDNKALPGLATHRPFQTTQNLLDSPVLDLFEVYMMPINRLGYLMDCEQNLEKERAHLRSMTLELDKTVIAKKILAAGIMTPEDAFEYLKTLDYVDMVTLGIASEKEAQETWDTLKKK